MSSTYARTSARSLHLLAATIIFINSQSQSHLPGYLWLGVAGKRICCGPCLTV